MSGEELMMAYVSVPAAVALFERNRFRREVLRAGVHYSLECSAGERSGDNG
jgi:hypothetical protein